MWYAGQNDPNLHIYHRPRTFVHQGPGGTVALVGFPFARRIRDRFPDLAETVVPVMVVSTVLFEFAGPIATRLAFTRTGRSRRRRRP